jgi:DNA-binding response OmpR family regulator
MDEREGIVMAARILVVDDDAIAQAVHGIALSSRGYVVETAASAEVALMRLRCESFDAVISDVMMANVDGIGLARAMRRDPRLIDTPILLITALHDRETRIRALEFADCILTKPVDLDELYLCLVTLLRRRMRVLALRECAGLKDGHGFPAHTTDDCHAHEEERLRPTVAPGRRARAPRVA